MSKASDLYATDDTFREVADLLFGGGADHLISKLNPDQSELHATGSDRKKRAVTAGLSAVGATAGAAGLAYAGHKTHKEYKAARVGGRIRRSAALRTAVKNEKLGTALIPLEIAGLGGEVMATKILHNDTKKQPMIHKSAKDIVEQASGNPRRKLTQAAIGRASDSEFITTHKGNLKKLPNKVVGRQKVKKSVEEFDVVWRGEISKVDDDKRQVFGWASIVEMNGEPVVDLQGDYISVDEIEKSAYDYVHKSRKGGDMHKRAGNDPHHVSDMIESFVVTPEKKEKLGLPAEFPVGWWVGYQVHDDETWNLVKSGKRTGFSIHGSGTRKAM